MPDRKKHCVAILIRNAQGKYLLQMRDGKPGIYRPLQWDFFGGGAEENESAMQTAAREIGEELEIAAVPKDFTLLGTMDAADIHDEVVEYAKRIDWGDFRVREGAGAGFFSKTEALTIDLTPQTKRIVEQYFS